MANGVQTERAVLDIVELRKARKAIADEEALGEVDRVIDRRREDVGETVSKAVARRLLGVSRQALDKWIGRGLLPAVRGTNGYERIPREPLEELVEQVTALREAGRDRAVLAEALRRLAAEDTATQRAIAKNLGPGLRATKEGRLKKFALPANWNPED